MQQPLHQRLAPPFQSPWEEPGKTVAPPDWRKPWINDVVTGVAKAITLALSGLVVSELSMSACPQTSIGSLTWEALLQTHRHANAYSEQHSWIRLKNRRVHEAVFHLGAKCAVSWFRLQSRSSRSSRRSISSPCSLAHGGAIILRVRGQLVRLRWQMGLAHRLMDTRRSAPCYRIGFKGRWVHCVIMAARMKPVGPVVLSLRRGHNVESQTVKPVWLLIGL